MQQGERERVWRAAWLAVTLHTHTVIGDDRTSPGFKAALRRKGKTSKYLNCKNTSSFFEVCAWRACVRVCAHGVEG